MSEAVTSDWGFRTRQRPGSVALQCGLILFAMGAAAFTWEQRLIEGPSDAQLVAVPATLLSIDCELIRSGGTHSSVYGEPVVSFEYRYEGQTYSGDRYHRQRSTPVGSMAECRELVEGLRAQPSVQAWIDPARPEFAVLSKHLRPQAMSWIFMAVGAAFAALGVYRLLRSRGWTRDND